jgi:2-methylcitrate dehydratase PrpD
VRPLVTIAEFVQGRDLANMPEERVDRVKRHVLDTWAAQIAGSRTVEGEAVGRLPDADKDGVLGAVVAGCAQARCTEIDDIHLTSCTTPGSVVVSTAVALARDRASAGAPISVRDVCAAVVAGYEAMIRVGIAIDGPAALLGPRGGLWPTGFAAAFGAAATACRACGLSVEQTAGALATSLAFAQRASVSSSPSSPSRWLTLGVAAASGVIAARGARAGLVGTIDAGLVLSDPARLMRGVGRTYVFDDIGMKPYPTARQALAAIEAAREIAVAERLESANITAVIVSLPERQRVIVDRRGFPASRFESIVNVRYQVALALVAPERLIDVQRAPLFDDPGLRRVMAKVSVRRAPDLDAQYPRVWPARVEIKARGRRFARVVRHPRGDARRPMGWDDVMAKALAIAGPIVGAPAVQRLATDWRATALDAPMTPLWRREA